MVGPGIPEGRRDPPVGDAGQLAVQVTVGIELVPFQEPMNPKLVLPPACRPPFQDRFFAVTVDPLVVTVALQAWVMVCPLAYVQVTVQPLIAEEPAVTLTSPWNPLGHCEGTV